jgi:PAS domain S-box-containing protein
MSHKLFGGAISGTVLDAAALLENVLESSTEYSIIGQDLDGKILLWNEGARRLYGYDTEEVVGKVNSSILHTPEDVAAGGPAEFLATALRDGKWEGSVLRVRKSGQRFTARVVITPRRNGGGQALGFVLISKDMSDEIQLTEQLQATQFYTRSLIESNIDALMTTDTSGVITDVNQQMEVLTGRRREELIGTLFKGHFTEPARAENGINLVLREGRVTNYELAAIARDGHTTVVSCNASIFRDAGGRLQGVFAAARDISEQRALEQKVRDFEAYNRRLIEASIDGLITVDRSGTISDVNDQMCRMSGFSRKELVGAQFASYFVDRLRAAAGVEETFERGVVTDYVLTLARRDGRQLQVSFNASIFRDSSGEVRGIFASARDITAQKQLESQLQASQFYTRSLIESNIDALMTTDPHGVITDVNQQMETLTGLTREQLIGTPFRDYFTDPARAEDGIHRVLQELRVTDYELTARAVTGRETVVSYNAVTFFNQAGQLQGVFAAARDVTERKRFEQALQEKNLELENANRAKDRFLASMSHELRTPLNAIIGFTGTLLMQLPGPLTEEQEHQLRTIQSSSRHLLSLINDLLNLAKIESGKVELAREPVDCEAAFAEVATALKPLAVEKGLEFATLLREGPIVVRTDRRALVQILLNLVGNAIKFTERGRVELACSRLDSGEQGLVELSVTDTGPGILPEDQKKLFCAFSRLSPPGLNRPEGTGLGLHLCQKLARLLGGDISFSSEFGRGSRFMVRLSGD